MHSVSKSSSNSNSTRLNPTGIEGLDEILHGGILIGNVILVEGMPGVGKTTLALEFIYKGITEYNEPGIVVTFENTPEKIFRDALSLGWDFRKLQNEGKLSILQINPEDLLENLKTSNDFLKNQIQALDAKRIVIDGITVLKIFGENYKGVPLRDSLFSLINTLSGLNINTLLTTEMSCTSPFGETGASQEHFLCDTIITLRNQAQRRSVRRSIEVAKSRGQDFVSGRHSFKIHSGLGIQVYPRVYARLNQKLTQRTSTQRSTIGNGALDEMLGGGVLDGSSTLVVGISGTGKSVLGLNFLTSGAELGKKGLLVTLDEHPEQILRNADGLGLKFSEYVKNGDIEILYDTPMELDIDEHFYKIKKIVEEKGIDRIVLDSLAAYEAAQPEEAYEFTLSLSSYFKDRLIPSVFNFECPELLGISQISDKLKASALVDNIILLNYIEISTMLRRAVTVPKSRGSKPDQRTREYVIKEGGIAVLEDNISNVDQVPQLPLSAYYGVLARSPTRHSPIIDEHVATGKPMPRSKLPKVAVRKKASGSSRVSKTRTQ